METLSYGFLKVKMVKNSQLSYETAQTQIKKKNYINRCIYSVFKAIYNTCSKYVTIIKI